MNSLVGLFLLLLASLFGMVGGGSTSTTPPGPAAVGLSCMNALEGVSPAIADTHCPAARRYLHCIDQDMSQPLPQRCLTRSVRKCVKRRERNPDRMPVVGDDSLPASTRAAQCIVEIVAPDDSINFGTNTEAESQSANATGQPVDVVIN